ncbi:MAG: AEC family transporter [Clostridia bacterium]|nr:AEC family transporter [Clostridia bacterium]
MLKKLKVIKEGATHALSTVLLYVCQPALAIKAFCVFSKEEYAIVNSVDKLTLLKNFGITTVITVVSIVALFLICKAIFFKSKNKAKTNVYSFVAMFSNCGFLGIPFIQMFTDNNPLAVMYMMVFNVSFNVLCWTLGVYLVTGDAKNISLKKVLLNPTLISNFLGLIIFFIPQINIFMFEGFKDLQTFPLYLSYMTAPISMIIVGIRLAETPVKQLFCHKGVYISSALRLVVSPFLTLLIALPFIPLLGSGLASGFEEYVYLAPVIAMAMSPAAAVVAIAEAFGGDRDSATSSFVTGTLISIITIPLVISAVMAIL